MSQPEPNRPVRPGDPAPGFELPAVTRDGYVRLDDFRGSRPVLLSLLRGLDCAFCRRHVANLGNIDRQLRDRGVETLAVVNTPVERARTYVRFHPMELLIASDEERATHRAYGLPLPEITEDQTDWPRRVAVRDIMAVRIQPTGDLPEPMDIMSAGKYLDAKDPYEMTEEDRRVATPGPQLAGAFLVDRDGIVRWTFIEAEEGPEGFARFPRTEEFLAAAGALS